MSFTLDTSNTASRNESYERLIPQLEGLTATENNFIANLANIASAMQETFNFLWIGFYRVIDNELVLGPFQGPMACTRIKKGKGVCGKSWENASPVIVEDVDSFEDHITCSSLSKSEIVVPYFFSDSKKVAGVLDIDSASLADFDNNDKKYLEKIAEIVSNCLERSNE